MDNIFEKKSNQHKYLRIRQALVDYIVGLEPGSRLLSERKLAVQVGCNVLTVRKAMLLLVDEGLVVRRSGSGTFVSDDAAEILAKMGAVSGAGANFVAQAGQERQSLVGMLIHSGSDTYALQINSELQRRAANDGIGLCCRMISSFGSAALEEIENMVREGCESVILPWFPQSSNEDVAAMVLRAPVPVVLPMLLAGLEKYCFQSASCFGQNLIKGCSNLGAYYLASGHKRIAFLGPDQPESVVLQKNLSGYTGFICRNSLPSTVGLVGADSQEMDRLAQQWSESVPELAIISYDDDHALRFMTSMHKLGMRAPEDFCIASFGNSSKALLTDPPLSCVFTGFDHAAKWMFNNALALSKGMVSQAQSEAELKFVLRQSCGGMQRFGSKIDGVFSGLGLHLVTSCEDGSEFVEATA